MFHCKSWYLYDCTSYDCSNVNNFSSVKRMFCHKLPAAWRVSLRHRCNRISFCLSVKNWTLLNLWAFSCSSFLAIHRADYRFIFKSLDICCMWNLEFLPILQVHGNYHRAWSFPMNYRASSSSIRENKQKMQKSAPRFDNETSRRRVEMCKELLANPQDQLFYRRIVTCDEKWIYLRNPNKSN